jgi:hypothetical protein
MFSANSKARLAALTLAGAAFAIPAAALAGVVVKSTGPSSSQYPVGKKVDDDATITLKDGDQITVLTSRGTKVMRGAGTYKVGERPTATSARFAALTRTRAANRVRTGAIRSGDTGEGPTNPNLWYVDVTQAGTVCLHDLGEVRLWRPQTDEIATYAVASAAGSGAVDVTFDMSEAVAPLDPTKMALTAGQAYKISGPGNGGVEVTFALLDQEYSQADQLAEALIAAGCTSQVGLLADRLGG